MQAPPGHDIISYHLEKGGGKLGLHVVTGRCGSGKSAYLHRAAADCAGKRRKALMLVPDQDTFENERALMELTGRPLMEVQVLGFSRLGRPGAQKRRRGGKAVPLPRRPAHGSAQGH